MPKTRMPKTIVENAAEDSAEDIAMTKLYLFRPCEIRRFLADQSGTTAIEYGVIASIIATAIVAAVNLIGGEVAAMFQRVSFPT